MTLTSFSRSQEDLYRWNSTKIDISFEPLLDSHQTGTDKFWIVWFVKLDHFVKAKGQVTKDKFSLNYLQKINFP